MAKTKKKRNKTTNPHRPHVQLTDQQYRERLLVLLEARETHYDDQNAFFDLSGGQRQAVAQAEFELVARREKIPVMIVPIKGKPTLGFVFPPGKRPSPQVLVRGPGGEIKFRSPAPEQEETAEESSAALPTDESDLALSEPSRIAGETI